jgi:hypothetical protein
VSSINEYQDLWGIRNSKEFIWKLYSIGVVPVVAMAYRTFTLELSHLCPRIIQGFHSFVYTYMPTNVACQSVTECNSFIEPILDSTYFIGNTASVRPVGLCACFRWNILYVL